MMMLSSIVVAVPVATAQRRASLSLDAHDLACASQMELEHRIEERLDYDPFVTPAELDVGVAIEAQGDRLVATVTLRRANEDGEPGIRSLDAPRDACDELYDEISLAVSIAIDPEAWSRTEAPPPAPPPAAAIDREIPRAEQPLAVESPRYALVLGARGGLGLSPVASIGGRVEAQARFQAFALILGTTLRVPTSLGVAGGGNVSGSVLSGDLAACGLLDVVFGCVVASAGAFLGAGTGITGSRTDVAGYLAAGARVGLDVRIVDALFFRATIDIAIPIVSSSLVVGSEKVWQMSPVNAELMLAVGISF